MAYRYNSSTNGNHRTVSRTSMLRGRRSTGGRRKTLPPHLLPGVARRKSSAGKAIGALAGLAVAFFLFFVATVVAGALSTSAAVAATVQQYQEINGSLPNAAQVSADVFQTTRILDRNGVLLQEIADQDYGWRTFVPFEKISPYLVDATIASEDATFWSHEGVEPYAIARGAIIIASGARGWRPSPLSVNSRSTTSSPCISIRFFTETARTASKRRPRPTSTSR